MIIKASLLIKPHLLLAEALISISMIFALPQVYRNSILRLLVASSFISVHCITYAFANILKSSGPFPHDPWKTDRGPVESTGNKPLEIIHNDKVHINMYQDAKMKVDSPHDFVNLLKWFMNFLE